SYLPGGNNRPAQFGFDNLTPYQTFLPRANERQARTRGPDRDSGGLLARFSLLRCHRPGPRVTGLVDADLAAARERDLGEQPPTQALHRGACDAAPLQI